MDDTTDLLERILSSINGTKSETKHSGSYKIPDSTIAGKIETRFLELLPERIGVGNRWTKLRSYAGVLWACGYDDDDIKTKCGELNKIRFAPQKPDGELKDEIEKICEWLNTKPKGIPQKTEVRDRKRAGKNDNEKIQEYAEQERGWFEREGQMYLEVIENSEEIPSYIYATIGNDGKIYFIDEIIVKEPLSDGDEILVSGLKYVPRRLPLNKDGQVIPLVGIPSKAELERIAVSDAVSIKDMIYTHTKKYCDMSHNDVDLCVFYIFMTWFYPKLSTLPYLRFRSDTGKGKSRILKTVSDLCFMPVKAGGASTSAGTIRMQEYWHGTLVIDEADIKGSSDAEGYQNDMIKYLNLGFESGQYFIKSDKLDPKQQEVFDPFCPKVIAMRGIFQDPATEGRCLSISPSETERKDIPAILPDEYQREVRTIRASLAHFMLTHWGCITENDPYPSFNDVDCEPRLKQLGAPLARILSKIFPDGLTEFKSYIECRQQEVKQDRAQSFFGCVANAAYELALDAPEHVTVREVAEATGITSQKASRVLKDIGMGVEPRKCHIDTTMPNQAQTKKSITQKVAVVKDARSWREICRRYIVNGCEQSQIGNANDLVDCPLALRSKEFVMN